MHTFRTLHFLPRLLGIALGLAATPSAWSRDASAGAIRIDTPWARATPPAAPTGAGYMSLINEGKEADRLLEITSPIAARADIHTMEIVGDVSRMRWQKDGVELKPGGVHIMFLELKQPIRPETKVPVTLVLQRAGKVEVELLAAPIGATSAPGGSANGAAHHGKH